MREAHLLPPPGRTSAKAVGLRAQGPNERPTIMAIKHSIRDGAQSAQSKGMPQHALSVIEQ